jgi:uncharacterized protein (DUF924 family)
MLHTDVIHFWFEELQPAQWWKKDPEFDRRLAARFAALHRAACLGELERWRDTAEGRLAEIVVLDQFSRNIYRDQPQSFGQDGMALALAQEAVRCGDDMKLPPQQRVFLYMPYMHSESAAVHERALALFESLGIEENLHFELRHKEIIDRFGRYPHRNAVLGRESTEAERAFLAQPGSRF